MFMTTLERGTSVESGHFKRTLTMLTVSLCIVMYSTGWTVRTSRASAPQLLVTVLSTCVNVYTSCGYAVIYFSIINEYGAIIYTIQCTGSSSYFSTDVIKFPFGN